MNHPGRRLDLVLAAFFGLFTLGWLAFDLPVALGLVDPSTGWYATEVDPLFVRPPFWLEVVGVVAATYGPAYAAIAYGLVRDRRWVLPLGLAFAGLITGTNAVYAGVELFGSEPPSAPVVWWVLNGPYLVVPIALAVRCGWRVSRP